MRMLGTGRPFVLEIKEPKVRKIDLEEIAEEVAEVAKGKTEYLNLKFTERKSPRALYFLAVVYTLRPCQKTWSL